MQPLLNLHNTILLLLYLRIIAVKIYSIIFLTSLLTAFAFEANFKQCEAATHGD